MLPNFRDANEAYKYYADRRGLFGISQSVISKIREQEEELVKKATEIWRQAFPRSKLVIKDATHLRRLIGIFAAHSRRRPEIRPLYAKYRELALEAKKFVDSRSVIRQLQRTSSSYADFIYERPSPVPATMEEILNYISKIHDLISTLYSTFGELLEDEFKLSELFLQHEAHIYMEYESTASKPKNIRHMEYLFIAYVHAELMYIETEIYYDRLGPLGDKDWEIISTYINESEYGFISGFYDYSYFGISLSNRKYDYGFKDYPAELQAIDLDYSRTVEELKATLPWDWPKMPTKKILELFGIRATREVQLHITEFIK